MIIYNKYLVLTCSFLLITLIGCTENPFSNAPEVGATQISGQVLLSNESENSGVYVWIEQFGISAYTNSDGDFLITIPPPASQGGGSGIDGNLFMYFYLANYKLDSVRVVFLRGVPLVSKGDLNEEGNVTRIIQLSKLLNVKLSFFEKSISMSSYETLRIKITLTSPQIDPVAIIITKANARDNTPLPALFIKKVDSEESIFKMIDIGSYLEHYLEHVIFMGRSVTVIYDTDVGFLEGELPTGTYKVIPYVKVRDVNPPLELLKGLGEHVLEYHPDYLNLPFKFSSENIILTE